MSMLVKFVEEMCSVFDEGCSFVDQCFETVVNELRDVFCGMKVSCLKQWGIWSYTVCVF